MNRVVLDESVSAVMDGEADELELRRVLAATGEDPALRERWARYQLARDVMHRQTVKPGLDLASAVSAAIAGDEAQAAAAAPGVAASSGWRQLGRLAVAASVTLAVLAGVRFYNSQDEAAVAPQVAQQPAQVQQPIQPALPVAVPQEPAVLASFPAEETEPAKPEQPDDLLRAVPADGAVPPAESDARGR